IQVPPVVLVPAGQTSAVFSITIVDDTQIDGAQNATIVAHVANWTDGSGVITVRDNESTNLLVNLRSQASEAAGVITNGGSVDIAGTLPTNLTVSLSSSDTGRLQVPASVLIVAGQTEAPFNLTLIDNGL